MPRLRTILTTTFQEVSLQSKVKVFLDRKSRNSKNTANSYLVGLTRLQEFLNVNSYPVKLNDIDLLFTDNKENVYEFLDRFISYLSANNVSTNTIHLYVAAVKGYLENCDVEINPSKFKNKVTMPKNHREDEAAIDDADIRKILLACNNFRLKVYLLLLASGGMRATEALAIRLKDIDFSLTPTKIHIRKDYAKTKVSRDIYISEEATTYLKRFIAKKYSVARIRNENDLVFQMHRNDEADPPSIYHRIATPFQALLNSIGLDERKEGMQRRRITFHSFRRFAKTVIATQTSTDYSEWFLGHAKSPYFVQKEKDRRLLYATKCMPFLTFTDYSKLEQDASVKQTEVEMLMMKDANKDREIELLKQRVQVKDREIELLKQRDLAILKEQEEKNNKLISMEKQVRMITKTEEQKEEHATAAMDTLMQVIEGMKKQIKELQDNQKR